MLALQVHTYVLLLAHVYITSLFPTGVAKQATLRCLCTSRKSAGCIRVPNDGTVKDPVTGDTLNLGCATKQSLRDVLLYMDLFVCPMTEDCSDRCNVFDDSDFSDPYDTHNNSFACVTSHTLASRSRMQAERSFLEHQLSKRRKNWILTLITSAVAIWYWRQLCVMFALVKSVVHRVKRALTVLLFASISLFRYFYPPSVSPKLCADDGAKYKREITVVHGQQYVVDQTANITPQGEEEDEEDEEDTSYDPSEEEDDEDDRNDAGEPLTVDDTEGYHWCLEELEETGIDVTSYGKHQRRMCSDQ